MTPTPAPTLRDRGIRAILLDIEGTTTPIAFVHDVLFSFARAHMRAFVADPRNAAAVADVTGMLAGEHDGDLARGEQPPRDVVDYALWLMDRDRKSPGLKLLQGLIWERGYQAGDLRGQVFDDVPRALHRWRDAGIDVAIYSSGSELAQRRLFASTEYGDLTTLLCGFFDTRVGPKNSPDSYRRIADALGHPPAAVLFVSDVPAETAAARASGMHAVLRGTGSFSTESAHLGTEVVSSFDQIDGTTSVPKTADSVEN